jgi:hypothetical protein
MFQQSGYHILYDNTLEKAEENPRFRRCGYVLHVTLTPFPLKVKSGTAVSV